MDSAFWFNTINLVMVRYVSPGGGGGGGGIAK